MRRLIVMRHATAASGAGLATDHERPLTAHGSSEALSVGEQLVRLDWVPDVALVSDAARTTETWWCMERALGAPSMTELPGFYGGGVDALVSEVKRLPSSARTVLVLGHNPGWTGAVHWLSGAPVTLQPAHAALLVGDGERWSEVLGYGALKLADVVLPAVPRG